MTTPPDNDISNSYDDLLTIFNNTSIGLLYQLSPYLLDEETKRILDDLVGKAKVEFIAFFEELESERALNQQIEQWRNQKTDPKYTYAIVKIINNTSHILKITQTSLPLTQSDRETFEVPDEGKIAFKSEFAYNYAYPWGKNKIMFNHFIDFTDQDIGVRFDLGMIMNTSFGVFTPTLTPTIKNTVTSIGKSRINCSTKITSMSDDAPFSFEVEIILG